MLVDPTGERTYQSFPTEKKARQVMLSVARLLHVGSLTIDEALDSYEEFQKKTKGNGDGSMQTTRHRINSLIPDRNVLIESLKPAKARKYYEALAERVAVDTHRNTLAEAKTFFNWCKERRLVPDNPFKDVQGIGKRRRGKKQLMPGQAKQLFELALAESLAGNDGSFAAAVVLVMGPRQNGISRRLVGDVDVLSRRLYITGDKTEAGDRPLEIPEVLWPHFEMRIKGREGGKPLLPARSRDGFHCKDWVANNVKRLCRKLGLPPVSAHGLRGTQSSLARSAGVAAHEVARQLGHESITTTEAHYTSAEAKQTAAQREVLKLLKGGKE